MNYKYCLYSDIHGQKLNMDAVEEKLFAENPDKVLNLGDQVGLGPDPAEVVQRLMDRPEIDVIVGNVDLWVTRKVWETTEAKSPHQEWMFRMMEQTRERLNEDQLEWLDNLPFAMTYTPEFGHDLHIFHGTPYDIGDNDAFPFRLTDEEISEKLSDYNYDVMAHGHIHGPSIRNIKNGNKINQLVCAAAVGMSWDGDPRPSYAVVEYTGDGNWDCRIERVDCDVEAQAKLNESSWIEHSDRIAGMIRSGIFWNPDHMPH